MPQDRPTSEYAVVTHEQIASAWGVDRSYIGQLERSALRKLRAGLEQHAEEAGCGSVAEYLSTDTMDVRVEQAVNKQYEERLQR